MSLLYKVNPPDAQGRIQHITPEIAGWRYVGFSAYQLKKGQSLSLASGDKELCLVLIAGLASVKTRQAEFPNMGKRLSPFERTPPYSVYVPPDEQVEVLAESDLELAVCSAPGISGKLPVRLIAPQNVGVERRGKGNNQRLVHNILPDDKPADSLLVVEVYTDEGNTSSYPSHKHDREDSDQETWLEETYYHRFNPERGFAMQRVYTDDRSLDECMAPCNRDVVTVPRGYHPVATIAGYDNYYLNVMAGPVRLWKFSWEEDHAWVNSADYPRKRSAGG
ncbi:5-deoxy-glucuronate isomerase [Erwinia pyrifoliae]|uniref:5-deoxy-glucuronate isomerase n=1 Tax=Erwinia pyrifoliae TaxID=79967 RepID=A0ABY5X7Y8_ERWPY|nr:5-deoxy-glucuronate isomerase [Erwinia pyrifoliae]AUX71193.1 5-deoxy-glucuronate isomerase [Erwinia pyrifoliae]MCA8875089.1 5-deoxy-glucuronate isomerase [Erwinia pyrifoliae]MCT2385591.1 5-deoxy-glucuronate isomerase [Erwinia pyrifoliae]MCU8588834.1 5-deoxy-glucuronate isomerase [Erwinia pyrifoliae]UWS29188.1 5-deoxy-glucuronate isomerase [Erwinia pyrifoliae]